MVITVMKFTQEKKIMKYGRYSLLVITLLLGTAHAADFQDGMMHDGQMYGEVFDDLFDMEGEDLFLAEAAAGENLDITRAIISPDDAVRNLTAPDLVNAQVILQNPLYYRSNPPIRRNVIDFPIFQQFVQRGEHRQEFAFKPFFVQTFKEYFYDTRSNINYYIDMLQNELNAQIDLLSQIEDIDFKGFNLSNVLGLFETIYLEQRRAGFMFEYVRATERWTLSLRLPFLYDEHNLNMPEEDQAAVQSNPFFSDSSFDEMTFAREHLIADRLGFGDTRINLEYLIVESKKQIFSAGVRVTLPTAFAVKKGLYGTTFDAYAPAPAFNLYNDLLLPGLSTPPDQNIPLVQQNIQTLGNAVMDRLSTMVLESPSGNNHHLGLGIFSHNTMIFTNRLSLSGLASAEILLPATERRFFITYTPQAAYNVFDWEDTSAQSGQLQQKLTFLNEQFINKFFPTGYDVTVFPGLIIQSTSALTYQGKHVDFTAGTDLWWTTREKFLSIEAPENIKTTVLDPNTAKKGYGYQSMFWFSLEKKVRPGSSWRLGLRAQATANSFGVGQDWGACILIQKQF